ncbi:hypothetical protein GCM10022254_03760 [Actinomadura meridiana]|uniref:Integral membrane protein n=1 Tax=Actinomadura meridiana TaxID=559626 RepID=A0ABP8BSW4_9ACTN
MSLAKQGVLAGDGPGRPGGEALDAVVSGASYAVLGLFGALYGLVGSFLQGWTVNRFPVAAIVLVLLLFAAVRLAGWGMGGRAGPTIIALTWLVVVFIMSNNGPGGDLVMPAELGGKTDYAGYVYIIGGLAAAVLAVLRVRPSGSSGQWLLGRAGRTPR